MSVTKVRATKSVAASIDYLTHGTGKDRQRHHAEDTNRISNMYCDLGVGGGALREMKAKAEWIINENPTREVQGQAYIQSFAADEFDVNDPVDLAVVTDLGRQLAKKMHPNSDCLVVTHTDGEGGCAHNHILVLNHDNATGKALTEYRRPVEVERANDQVMRENDCRVLPTREERIKQRQEKKLGVKQPDPGSLYWDNLRQIQAGSKPFNDRLYAQVKAAFKDPKATDVASFDDALAARGVTRETTVRGGKVATVYKMPDDQHPKQRIRRAKASNLARGFTSEHLPTMFKAKAKMVAKKEAERQAEEAKQREAEEQAARAAAAEEKRAQQAEQAAAAAQAQRAAETRPSTEQTNEQAAQPASVEAPPSLASDEDGQGMTDAQPASANDLHERAQARARAQSRLVAQHQVQQMKQRQASRKQVPEQRISTRGRPQPKRRQAGEDGLSL